MVKKLLLLIVIILLSYAGGRAYYAITGGFTIGNISSDFPYNPRWDTHPLSAEEKQEIKTALDQDFSYLGRGCQSYVFASADGKYVIKFFKYQRFRTQAWIDLFTFIPSVEKYQAAKKVEKEKKLEKVFVSWKIAYEHLKDETGIVYVHLNKSNDWNQSILIKDKMGLEHKINLGDKEFLLQHRAVMLCTAIDELMAEGNEKQAEQLIDRLLAMLLMEYNLGYADNDHALMQNTGVLNGFPIHIDVGQFIQNDSVKAPKVYKQEIYDKTYNFHLWLKEYYPQLAEHLKSKLVAIVGPDYFYTAPYVHKGDVAKIPHQENYR